MISRHLLEQSISDSMYVFNGPKIAIEKLEKIPLVDFITVDQDI